MSVLGKSAALALVDLIEKLWTGEAWTDEQSAEFVRRAGALSITPEQAEARVRQFWIAGKSRSRRWADPAAILAELRDLHLKSNGIVSTAEKQHARLSSDAEDYDRYLAQMTRERDDAAECESTSAALDEAVERASREDPGRRKAVERMASKLDSDLREEYIARWLTRGLGRWRTDVKAYIRLMGWMAYERSTKEQRA